MAGGMVTGQSCCPHASSAMWPPHIHVIRRCPTKASCWSWAPELVQGRICYNLCENTGVWLPCSPGCDVLDAARAAEASQCRGSSCKSCLAPLSRSSRSSRACRRPAHLPSFQSTGEGGISLAMSLVACVCWVMDLHVQITGICII